MPGDRGPRAQWCQRQRIPPTFAALTRLMECASLLGVERPLVPLHSWAGADAEMKIRSHFSSVFLMLSQGSAFAENWVLVGPSPRHYTQHYDSASVGHDGARAGLISLTNYASPQTNSAVAGGSRNHSSQTVFMVFDCTSRQVIGFGQLKRFSNTWATRDLVIKADGFHTTHRPVNAGGANEAMYTVALHSPASILRSQRSLFGRSRM